MLTQAVQHAASAVTVPIPASAGEPARVLRWGSQLDVRQITMDGDLTDQAVAGYIAKYATKSAECVGALDRRVQPLDDLNALPVRDHARRLIAEYLRLGSLDELADLRLIHWAHVLGFRGHFSTKSRRYSTTLGALRAAQVEHKREEQITTGRLPLFDEDTVLVIAHWQYAGKGLSAGDALLAAALTGTPLSSSAPTGVVCLMMRNDQLLTVPEILKELGGVSRRTFYRWRELGHAPNCIKLPNGELRVRRSDLAAWLDTLREAA